MTCYDVAMSGRDGTFMNGSMRLNWGFWSSVSLLAFGLGYGFVGMLFGRCIWLYTLSFFSTYKIYDASYATNIRYYDVPWEYKRDMTIYLYR